MIHLTKRFDPEDEAFSEGIEAYYKEFITFHPTKEWLSQSETIIYGINPSVDHRALIVYVVHGHDHLARFYTSLRLHFNLTKEDRFGEESKDEALVVYSGISNDEAQALRLICSAHNINYLNVQCPHKGGFCLSYFRNKSIEAASGFCVMNPDIKLVALVDCDFVPMQSLSSLQPSLLPTGYSKFLVLDVDGDKNPSMFRQGTLPDAIRNTARTNGKFIGPGWFIFRPELLFNEKFGHKLRFCEEYRGLGYEDLAFEHVVLRQHEVFRSQHNDFWAIHLSHPKPPMGDDYVANRKRYINQLVEITKNNNIRIDPTIMHREDVNAYCEHMKAELFKS